VRSPSPRIRIKADTAIRRPEPRPATTPSVGAAGGRLSRGMRSGKSPGSPKEGPARPHRGRRRLGRGLVAEIRFFSRHFLITAERESGRRGLDSRASRAFSFLCFKATASGVSPLKGTWPVHHLVLDDAGA
jgi:hypothetical protein